MIFTANGPDRVKRFDLESMTTTTLQNVGPTSAASAPAVIDINGDRTLEVFVGTDDGRLHGLRENDRSFPVSPSIWEAGADVGVVRTGDGGGER
ncbi:MAG: hypothetical protein IPK72_17650 [Candidatus Eisenbacteria bacterium]|nr:hypothetical protein [Candidatus Eisenbacteria bacterium]